jgi:hypothetical protein
MRTKITILSAAALAAGILSSQAQVFSANIVGYANVVLTNGFNMVANPFNAGSSNGMNEIFPSLPDNTSLFQWNQASSTFRINIYDSGGTGDPNSWFNSDESASVPIPTIAPGAGFFLSLPNSVSTITNTFVGSVAPQVGGSVSNLLLRGFNMVGSQIPLGGNDSGVLWGLGGGTASPGFLPDNTAVYQWQRTTKTYVINIFDTGGAPRPLSGSDYTNGWFNSDESLSVPPPPFTVGQGFFLVMPNSIPIGGINWVQTLSIQ